MSSEKNKYFYKCGVLRSRIDSHVTQEYWAWIPIYIRIDIPYIHTVLQLLRVILTVNLKVKLIVSLKVNLKVKLRVLLKGTIK